MKGLIILLIAFVSRTSSIICDEPQRKLYMSYASLAKRDALTNLFAEISGNMAAVESTYTDSALQATFRIPNLKASAYYNDHYQREAYLDRQKVNVTMGDIVVATRFNFSIAASANKSGIIEAKGRLDPSYFSKNLVNQQGYLEWEPETVPLLTFTQFFTIQYSEPKLNDAQTGIFTKMLNNQAGSRKIKGQIIDQINAIFAPILKKHLNHEDLISTNSITYKYQNITLDLRNGVKESYMSNGTTKGLEAFMTYGLQSSSENCTSLGKEFDQGEYGGFQEVISFGVVRAMVKEAIAKGLYDVTLDRSWEVSTFQFYMGDLGNFVPYANYAPAGERFNLNCRYAPASRNEELKIVRYDEQEIYVSVPLSCELSFSGQPIIGLKLDSIIVARVVPAERSINVVVRSTEAVAVVFSSIDQNYKVEDSQLGKFFVGEVLKGLMGKNVFGSGFEAFFRKYPSVRVLEDRIILFDPAQQ